MFVILFESLDIFITICRCFVNNENLKKNLNDPFKCKKGKTLQMCTVNSELTIV